MKNGGRWLLEEAASEFAVELGGATLRRRSTARGAGLRMGSELRSFSTLSDLQQRGRSMPVLRPYQKQTQGFP